MEKVKNISLINLINYLNPGRWHFSEFRYYFSVSGCLLIGLISFPLPAFSEEPVDLESYRRECSQGMTIYCLAAGMEEQKSGNLESALKYYQSACESHSSQGNLRACTPYLSLASQMERLELASRKLESLCAEDDVICFYLAKEYFKIAEYHRGFVHLERLCRDNFQSPDALDYGPCYHLGINLKKIRDLKRARKIFNFDCDRDPVVAKPSCDQVEVVELMIQEAQAPGDPKAKEFEAIELAALGLVLVPLLGLVGLRSQRKVILKILEIPVPAVTLFCWALWEPYARRELTLRADVYFMIPAFVLALIVGWSANRKLKGAKAAPDACDSQ
jgi:tetratricopeptide (TPR) repeat protein